MSKKVYGIYSGCVHEGGGCDSTLFYDKSKAREYCLDMVEKSNKQWSDWNKTDDDMFWDMYAETKPDYWLANYECITIQEFDLV